MLRRHVGDAASHTNVKQFFICTRNDDLDMFHEKNTIFGQVVEGLETIMSINDAYCDTQNRPYQNIR